MMMILLGVLPFINRIWECDSGRLISCENVSCI